MISQITASKNAKTGAHPVTVSFGRDDAVLALSSRKKKSQKKKAGHPYPFPYIEN